MVGNHVPALGDNRVEIRHRSSVLLPDFISVLQLGVEKLLVIRELPEIDRQVEESIGKQYHKLEHIDDIRNDHGNRLESIDVLYFDDDEHKEEEDDSDHPKDNNLYKETFDCALDAIPDSEVSVLPVSREELREYRPEQHGAPIDHVPHPHYEILGRVQRFQVILVPVK